MVCDAAVLIGSAMALAGARRGASKTFVLIMIVVIAAWAGIAYYAWFSPAANINHQRLGFAWASGLAACAAFFQLGHDRRVRAIVIGVLAGLVAMLLVKGAVQVLIEHPELLASYKRDKSVYLQAQGWSEGSPMALAYERRLVQVEATGWFGLSNVYASFMAAGLGLGTALAAGCLSANARGKEHRLVLLAGATLALLGACGLAMAGSKGGFAVGAMVVVLGFAATLARTGRMPMGQLLLKHAGCVGPGLILGALALVALRGAIGERIGELSVLFRWFYLQAAGRIFAQAPVLGVGPDGFKDAYLLAKNPLSPEEITSPHSLMFDWAACLGIAGVALGVMLLVLSWRASRGLAKFDTDEPAGTDTDHESTRWAIRLSIAAVVIASFAAVASELALLAPSTAQTRIGTIVIGAVVAGVMAFAAMRSRVSASALTIAALGLMAHTQIEVTGIWVQSCGLLLAIVGCAAGSRTHQRGGRAAPLVFAGVALLAGVVIAWQALGPVRRWERTLISAAEELRPISDIPALLRQVSRTSDPAVRQELLSEAQAQLNAAAGKPVAMNEQEVSRVLEQLTLSRVPIAYTQLQALETRPATDYRTWRERSRLAMMMAQRTGAQGKAPSGENWLDAATDVPDVFAQVERASGRASLYAWVGTALSESARSLNRREDWIKSEAAFDTALRLDPYNLQVAMGLLRAIQSQGPSPRVQVIARRVLEINALQRLDAETRMLEPRVRGEVEALAKGGESEPKQPPPKP
jgi:hypothetical protein